MSLIGSGQISTNAGGLIGTSTGCTTYYPSLPLSPITTYVYSSPSPEFQVRRAGNGLIVTHFGKEFVFKDAKDMAAWFIKELKD